MSFRVRTVKRRSRSCPNSVIVNTSTPTTVSTAIAPITTPSPTRARFMSERLADGEVKRQPIQYSPQTARAFERVIGLQLLERHDAALAIVLDYFGNDWQILFELRLDAEIDTDWTNRRRVSKAEARRDGARALRERRDVAFADDADVDEYRHVERTPEPEAILDAAFEQCAATNGPRLEITRGKTRGVAFAPQEIISSA